jgi:hypothetical protein
LEAYLREVRREVGGGRDTKYVALNKESHVIEVPEVSRAGGCVGVGVGGCVWVAGWVGSGGWRVGNGEWGVGGGQGVISINH